MINYIEVGKLVASDKEIRKHSCWGMFDTFWGEVQRNYADREDLVDFSKDDWRCAYERALNFVDLDSCLVSAPPCIVLDTIAKNFLLGRSHHEWVKHFNRAGYLSASQP